MDCQHHHTTIVRLRQLACNFSSHLSRRCAHYIAPLLLATFLAVRTRRTVTQWIKWTKSAEDFRQVFYHLSQTGRKAPKLYVQNLTHIIEYLRPLLNESACIKLVADDSPTKRYGNKIEGAGKHHNPTPGKTDAEFCWGHSWVVLCLVIKHPLWGDISFPISARLYIQEKVIEKLRGKYKLEFKTKTAMLVEMINELTPYFTEFEKRIEVIVDGGYAKESVIIPLCKTENICTITRLRRDCRLFELPPEREKGKRGRPAVKGNRIDVRKMIDDAENWEEVNCNVYGKMEKKRYKTLIAVSALTGWKPVRIVLLKESDKTWLPLLCTEIGLSAQEIIESYGVRFGIEEVFKDLKGEWGWGKQEVRKLESNIGVTAMNMLMYSVTELLCWNIPAAELLDRNPWDAGERRPSHREKRRWLRGAILQEKLNSVMMNYDIPQEMIAQIKNLALAA